MPNVSDVLLCFKQPICVVVNSLYNIGDVEFVLPAFVCIVVMRFVPNEYKSYVLDDMSRYCDDGERAGMSSRPILCVYSLRCWGLWFTVRACPQISLTQQDAFCFQTSERENQQDDKQCATKQRGEHGRLKKWCASAYIGVFFCSKA